MEQSNSSHTGSENLGSFSYYVEIIGILSQVHQFLKKPVDISALSDVEQWQQEYRNLDNKLSHWKFRLPNEYGDVSLLFIRGTANKTLDSMEVMLHVSYYT